MPLVHIFSSLRRFNSPEELRRFIAPTYTEDGDEVDSPFMREVKFDAYEPMCIESIHSQEVVPLGQLLQDFSYSGQWLPRLTADSAADAVVCVFEPNVLRRPGASSLRYHGALEYVVPPSQY